MNFIEFENELNKRAGELDYQQRISRGLEICKRLFPFYKTFHNETGFGDPDVLLDSIRFVESGDKNEEQLGEYLDALEDVSPDTDDYEEGEYALNACGAVNALLLQLAEPEDPEHYIEIAMAYYDTIDFQLQDESENELSEEEISNHPLMLEAQKLILQG